MHSLVRLVKKTVEAYVRKGEVFQPKRLTAEMKEQAGVFVSIHKLDELRGCIGTFEPQHDNVAEEIVANAISSASRDPRFLPVSSWRRGGARGCSCPTWKGWIRSRSRSASAA